MTGTVAIEEPYYIAQARDVLANGFYSDLNEQGAVQLDATTAQVMVQVWEALGPERQAKLAGAQHVEITRYVDFCWSVVR